MSQGQYASVNGLKMYYEIHGAGQPLATAVIPFLNAPMPQDQSK